MGSVTETLDAIPTPRVPQNQQRDPGVTSRRLVGCWIVPPPGTVSASRRSFISGGGPPNPIWGWKVENQPQYVSSRFPCAPWSWARAMPVRGSFLRARSWSWGRVSAEGEGGGGEGRDPEFCAPAPVTTATATASRARMGRACYSFV